jgi:CDP-paratose 2-epimerase
VKIIVTGICGFVGAALANEFQERIAGVEICGIDNLIRPGVHVNRQKLLGRGIRVWHGDVRMASDWETLPAADWLIDAAANPSVLAGVDGQTSSRQLLEHNLGGTINALEYCKRHRCGLILISTSRVYSVAAMANLPIRERADAFDLDDTRPLPSGVSPAGLNEEFSTAPPLSLYGNSKLCSELLALEYGQAFGFPVWIDRCGVLAGAGQFGKVDQGIFSYWIHSWQARRPLKYIGFAGSGHQVRDAFHPADLAILLADQMRDSDRTADRVFNLGGGSANSMSLAQLSGWCADRFGSHEVTRDTTPRPYDIPWVLMDSAKAHNVWDWSPKVSIHEALEKIACHAEANPQWLELSL